MRMKVVLREKYPGQMYLDYTDLWNFPKEVDNILYGTLIN